jgi:hypothetical protein
MRWISSRPDVRSHPLSHFACIPSNPLPRRNAASGEPSAGGGLGGSHLSRGGRDGGTSLHALSIRPHFCLGLPGLGSPSRAIQDSETVIASRTMTALSAPKSPSLPHLPTLLLSATSPLRRSTLILKVSSRV